MGLTLVQDGQEKWLKFLFHPPAALANEQQSLTITGSPGGGTFKLKAGDPYGTYETISIAYNAAAADVQSALQTLTPIGSGNVSVSGSAGGPWTVSWQAALAGKPIPLLILSVNAFTGGSSPSLTVARVTAGVGTVPQFYYLGLSQSLRATLGETITLSGITEVTGTGYARVAIKNNVTEWVPLLTAGYWQVTSAIANFTAGAGDWTIQRSLFLTDTPSGSTGPGGFTGRVLDVRDITPITLGSGNTQGYDWVEAFKAPA